MSLEPGKESTAPLIKTDLAAVQELSDDENESNMSNNESGLSTPYSSSNNTDAQNNEETKNITDPKSSNSNSSSSFDSSDEGNGKDGNGGMQNISGTSPKGLQEH